MRIRKITSLTAALAFILMVLTSIILYIVPQGRVAYWADWRLWGLTKTDWGNIHINLGLLFLIALFLHIYYNWKPLMSYLKDKAKQKVLTPEFNVALAITAASIVGTYLLVPPFSWVMALNDHFKDAGAEKYGEPPYGHAELSSLSTFANKMGFDVKESLLLIKMAGLQVESDQQTLADIGRLNHVPPQKIYLAMKPATGSPSMNTGRQQKLPDEPPPGTGNLTLADLCNQYDFKTKIVLEGLSRLKIEAREDMEVKKIAEANHISPLDVYEKIKSVASAVASSQASR
ncbi:MAG: DUF4405 domain-containing protein [Desulfobacterales bacterium]